MKHIKKIIFAVLFILVLANIAYQASLNQKEYTTRFDPDYWEIRYITSQWVISNSKTPIGDDGLYAYAGWQYVHGTNPVLLNAEIPPLGKYLIGIGEVAFGNQNILMLIVGILCLLIFYFINLRLFKNKLLAFIPVALFSFDPLFYAQYRAPYLDTMYLLFLLLTLLYVMRKKYFLASFFLGCFASIKFPVGSLFLVAPMAAWVVLYDRKNITKFLLSLVLWPVMFLLFYERYFILGGTPIGFLGVQKWIVYFYSAGAKSAPGIIYPMILFGKWFTWFAGVQKVPEWTFFWPVSFMGSVFAALPLSKTAFMSTVYKSKKHTMSTEDKNMILVLLWAASYLIFLSFTPAFPRYLLLLLPFMYNLTVWFLAKYVLQRF